MSKLQRISVGALAFVMTLTMSFVVAPAFANAAVGDLVKGTTSNTVYVVDADGVTIHPFPHSNVYKSWGYPADFSTVKVMDLSSYTVGNAVEFRDGSLVKSNTAPDVYYIENRVKMPILSEATFLALGLDWDDITWLTDAFLADYTTGTLITTSGSHVDGQLVKYAGDPAIYLLDGGAKRAFQSAAAFEANRYGWGDFLVIPDTETYPDGPMVMGYEAALSLPMGIGAGVVVPAGSGLSVAMDASNPTATTIVADGTTHAQTLVPFLAVRFTAAADGDVKVTSLKFKRKGISADDDVITTYLYEDNMRLEVGGSLSSNMVTFNNPNGLFTVPAGQSKVVVLRGDMKATLSAGKTIGFDLVSASDVVTNGASVSGAFPAMGNLMTTARASDLGYVTIGGSYAEPSSDDTGKDTGNDEEVWNFQLTANDQDMHIQRMLFTKVGSVQKDDLRNFHLLANGVEVAVVDSMNTDFEVLFDLSSNPLEILKGQSKTMSLRADIVKGSSRDFKFTFQQADDILVMDQGYGVYVPADDSIAGYGSWGVIQPSGDYLIDTGDINFTKASTSPTASLPVDATNQHIARFEVRATGENVKVNNLKFTVDTSSSDSGLDNGRILLDGVQIGSTTDLPEFGGTTTTVTFGSSFIARAGEVHNLDVYADMKTTSGGSLTGGETVQVYLAAGTSNAQAMDSLTSLSRPSSDVTGNAVTVNSGSLTFAETASVGDQTVLAGTQNIKIAAFNMVAGASDSVSVNSITITASSTEAGYLRNMKLMENGVQVGSLKATPSTSNIFSASIALNPGASKTVEVWADTTSDATGIIELGVEGSGTSGSGNSVSAANAMLQDVTLGSGYLEIAVDASNPEANFLLAPSASAYTVAVYKFSATTTSYTVDELTLIASTTAVDSVSQVILEYPDENGTTQQWVGSFSLLTGTVTAYDLGFVVPKDDSAKLTVKVNTASTVAPGAADNDDNLRIAIDVSGTFKATDEAGTADTDLDATAPVNETSDLLGNTHQVFKTYPTVVFASDTPSGTLIPSANTLLAKINVTASGNDDVSFENADANSLVIQVSSSRNDDTGGNWDDTLTFKDDQGNTLYSTTTDFDLISEFTCDFSSNDLQIAQGTYETIFVYASTSEFEDDGDNIQVWLDDTAGDIDWGIDGSGSYNHGDIIFRGDLYGGALAK